MTEVLSRAYRSHYLSSIQALAHERAQYLSTFYANSLPCAFGRDRFCFVAALWHVYNKFDYDGYMAKHGFEPNNDNWYHAFISAYINQVEAAAKILSTSNVGYLGYC